MQNKPQENQKDMSKPASDRCLTIKRLICPCFFSSFTDTHNDLDSSVQSKVDKQSIIKSTELQINGGLMLNSKKSRKRKMSEQINNEQWSNRQALLSGQPSQQPDKTLRQSMHIELSYNNRIRSLDELHLSVCNMIENYLISMGSNSQHILLKISPVMIQSNPDRFKKEMIKKSSKKEKEKMVKYNKYQFNRFWDERYQFFERFDEGIKIREDSWSTIPSEALAQYIASKCNGAKVILDAFANIGSTSIKLANLNSCQKVIANQTDKEKLSFLLNNAKTYEVDNFLELSNQEFLKIERKGIDVVFVQPTITSYQNQKNQISSIMSQCMLLAPNFIMLLPPEASIELLSIMVNKWAKKLNWMKDFCSIKIEKIYIKQQVKYLLLCAGKLVQKQIKLNDQLQYVYRKLKKQGEGNFKHKKIVKKIRQEYGMLELLHLVKLSQKQKKATCSLGVEGQTIDFFYDLITKKNLVSSQKLTKIRLEQEQSVSRTESLMYSGFINSMGEDISYRASPPVMEEEKIEESPRREPELTNSEYSYISYFQSIGRKQGEVSMNSINNKQSPENNSGVIIKRNSSSGPKEEENKEESSRQVNSSSEGKDKKEQSDNNNLVSVGIRSSTLEMETRKEEDYRKSNTFIEE